MWVCFVGSLILLTFIKFKKEKLVLFLSENSLSGLNKTMPIDKNEKFVLELLIQVIKEKKVDNSFVLNYFQKQ